MLLESSFSANLRIITPSNESERGCQLSILFPENVEKIMQSLKLKGIICDDRKPNVIRIAPVPLYNSFRDIFALYSALLELPLKEF